MSHTKSTKVTKVYPCEWCKKEFNTKQARWAHMNNKKHPCASIVVLELTREKDVLQQRLEHFQTKFLEQTVENAKLKDMLLNNSLTHDNLTNGISNHANEVNMSYPIRDVNPIEVSFSKVNYEYMNHITHDMMLHILDQPDFNGSITKLMQIIYFHPLAPQNWLWSVLCREVENGSLEYDHDSNEIHTVNTNTLIQTRFTNIILKTTLLLHDLHQQKTLTERQEMNYVKLCSPLETEFLDLAQVESIKNMAFIGKNLPMSMWEYLQLDVDTEMLNKSLIWLKEKYGKKCYKRLFKEI